MRRELTTEEIRRLRLRRKAAAQQQGELARRKQRREKKSRADASVAAALMRLVSDAQRSEFSQTLSSYEEATVEALMENGRQLENARARLNTIVDDAYRLDNGRAVFKTRDGLMVVDEDGAEVGDDEITPEQILDHHPRWETYRDHIDERDRLLDERQDLLEFQHKLDDARDRLDDENLTTDELDALGNELEQAMPTAVRKRLLDGTKPGLTKAFSGPARHSGPRTEQNPATAPNTPIHE